ncbi:MAG TPA: phosphotransferase [Thermoanaerobaculia bacterium]|nr:phosphotransferase [Thermoanaerobaculia bacterium]
MPATAATPPDPALAAWIATLGDRLLAVAPLAGDVSPRRYARLELAGGGTAILASYPEEVRAALPRFAATTELLAAGGVRVPRVVALAAEPGWMLLEDLGTATLADWRRRPRRELARWFAEGRAVAGRIAALPAAAIEALNPPLDRELLERELEQTWRLHLEPEGLVGDAGLARELERALATLCASLAAEAAVPCHRDFMARNLMPLPAEPSLAVLDHQDLRLGPPAYDLASLLNDTLFPSPELEEELVARALPGEGGRVSYHRAAAQRTLKAVGTYVSFARRGAPRHLPLVAPTLARALGHLARTPEGTPLAPRLAPLWSRVPPAA